MRVLVTGHRGYIGAVMASVLQNARFDVVGLDCDLYGACEFGRTRETVPSYDTDLRDIEWTDLLSFDAVVHLAALPEDFDDQIDPQLTEEINLSATIRLAECCKRAQISRFLFASTCAVYGRDESGLIREDGVTHPLSAYAKSKLECERELSRLSSDTFAPVLLRNGTVYGVSPRLRLDTVVNDFVGAAFTNGRIDMQTEGRAWRPLIHVEDVARAYAAVLAAPDKRVAGHTFNVVASKENFRVIDVADMVTELIPHTTRFVPTGAFDRRSYRVDGTKLSDACPKLSMRWTLREGIRQLRDAMNSAGMTPGDWRSGRYRRIARLSSLMERGELDASLRRPSELVSSTS